MEPALNNPSPKDTYRLTEIVFTLGPDSSTRPYWRNCGCRGRRVPAQHGPGDPIWTRTMMQRVRDMCGARAGTSPSCWTSRALRSGRGPAAPMDLAQGQVWTC